MSGFKEIVGHKNIIQYIENVSASDQVSHAYILNGEKGSGKRLLADFFAMDLQCEDREPDGEACGRCHSCRQAMSGNQPDIIFIRHEKPNTISVEEIRTQLNNDIVIRPYSSKYKIYIVPHADKMSVQAQNALLKTIEEPPEYAVIILLTENAEILLPTIRSRCVILKLRNIKDQLIKKYLMEQMEIPDYKADTQNPAEEALHQHPGLAAAGGGGDQKAPPPVRRRLLLAPGQLYAHDVSPPSRMVSSTCSQNSAGSTGRISSRRSEPSPSAKPQAGANSQ